MLEFTSQILYDVPFFVLIGVIHILIIEHKSIIKFIKGRTLKKKNIKQLLPIANRSSYLVLGLLVIWLSYAIVNNILSISAFHVDVPEIDYSNGQINDFWSFVKYKSDHAGLIAVMGVLASGICLILSGGGRWLVNLAKLFFTLSVLYIVLTILVLLYV